MNKLKKSIGVLESMLNILKTNVEDKNNKYYKDNTVLILKELNNKTIIEILISKFIKIL